jgi:Spy/CpxP family protein refolding chaperone
VDGSPTPQKTDNHQQISRTQMNIRPFTTTATVFAAALLLHAPLVSAQDDAPPPPPPEAAPGAPGAPGGPGGDQNGGDRREQFRQRMNERLKTSLKATDDEWSVIQPLLEKVQDKQREVMAGRFGGAGGPGGPGGGGRRNGGGNNGGNNGGADANARPAGGGGGDQRRAGRGPTGTAESQALRSALETDGTSTTDIKAKLEALRASRKQAATEMAAAREDLKKVLNLRQEAIFVLAGILE